MDPKDLNRKACELMQLGKYEEAIPLLEEACHHTPDAGDIEFEKQRVTYLLNLGEARMSTGPLLMAEDAIRRSLAGRKEIYSSAHPGYAFALEPLAAVLLRQGKPWDALDAIEECVANFQHHQHPGKYGAYALRTEILAALEKDGIMPPPLSKEELPHFADALFFRLERMEPQRQKIVLDAAKAYFSGELRDAITAFEDHLRKLDGIKDTDIADLDLWVCKEMQKRVASRMPPGLLHEFRVAPDEEGELQFEVSFKKEESPQERALLEETIRTVRAELFLELS